LKGFLTEKQFNDFTYGTGMGIIVKSQFIDYKFPATFPDNLILATKIGKLSADRYTQFTLLLSEMHERPVAKGETIIVAYNHESLSKGKLGKEYYDAYKHSCEIYGDQDSMDIAKH
jgi:acyl-CoA thioester hydrolase